MKKILFCLSALICLLAVSGCKRVNEETAPPPPPPVAKEFTLNYMAGPNGAIDGVSPQKVKRGEAGSTVRAVPANGYHFGRWSDGVTTASRTDAGVTADLSATAEFVAEQYTLRYTAAEHGTIEGAGGQTVRHGEDGTPVTAVPAKGYRFVGWSDGMETASRTDRKVTANLAVEARFTSDQYILTYTTEGKGTIDGTTPQTVPPDGDGSPVKAVPAKGSRFVGWSDGVTTPERTDHQVTADRKVTARFATNQYKLSYTSGGNGTIAGASSQTVDEGGSGKTVTAVPAVGYHFVGWSDGGTKPGRTDAKVMADLAVQANFAVNEYKLSYTAGEHGSIQGVSQQTIKHGADAGSVTAVPEKGYHFVRWSDGGTTAQRTDAKVTGELKVSAAFEIDTYTVGGQVSGLAPKTKVVLRNNGGDDLTIAANGEFKFKTKVRAAAPFAVTVQTQPTAPNQTCSVTGGSGTIAAKDVTEVAVACVLTKYKIGGTVSGLPAGEEVVLQNNGGGDLTVKANGTFAFADPLDDGGKYEVAVSTQPKKPNWTCVPKDAAGKVAGADVSNIGIDCYLEPVLKPTAGIGKVKLQWNSQDFGNATFNLCRAEEEIAAGGFGKCKDLKGGVLEAKVESPMTVSPLANDTAYWFQLEVRYADDRQALSKTVKAMPFGGLNDSGIDWCANDDANLFVDRPWTEKVKGCNAVAASYPNQDALNGRDALARVRKLTKTGSGSAGFDFTKLCRSGQAAGEGKCPPNPSPGDGYGNWACTHDNVTGLTWENKTGSGLRNKDNTYSWYSTKKGANGGTVGLKNGGICEDSACDTEAYVKAINDLGLCGASDWRLPTKRELLSIVDNGHFKPATDTSYFPNTLSSYYWTSSSSSEQEDSAWQVYFLYGEASADKKAHKKHIRLVRGKTVTFGLDNP